MLITLEEEVLVESLLEITTQSMNQASTQNSLQLRLDDLDISIVNLDSFRVDETGLVTIKNSVV